MKGTDRPRLVKSGILFLSACAYLAAGYFFGNAVGRMVIAFSVVPIAAAGWLFGSRVGIFSGIFAVIPNALMLRFASADAGGKILVPEFVIGSALLIVAGGIAGRVREDLLQAQETERLLRARERFLFLLNRITHAIIASKNFDDLPLTQLAKDFASLMEADDCYITRWDEKKQIAIPVASAAQLDIPFEQIQVLPRHKTLTASAFESQGVIVAEDLANTPYMSPELAEQTPAKSALCLPLIVGEARMGAVIVVHWKPHVFTEDEIKNAGQAGEQIALALWNTRRESQLQRRLRESNSLTRISRALSETERLGLTSVLQMIVNSAMDLIPGAEQAVIHSLDAENDLLMPEAAAGFTSAWDGKAKLRVGKGIAGQAIASGETINAADVQSDERFLRMEDPARFRSLMVTPIVGGEKTLGTISVQSKQPHAFSQDETDLLQTLGVNAAIAIESALLIESTSQSLRETSALYRINQGLAALDTDGLLNDAVNLLQQNFDYYHVQVFVVEQETGNFTLKAASGELGKRLVENKHQLSAGSGIIGYAAETGQPFFTNNVNEVVFFVYDPRLPNTTAELAIPIRNGNKLYGILDIQQTAAKPFSPRDQKLVTTVADQISLALQKAELYENLQAALQQEKTMRNQLVQNERLAIMGRLLASVSHELNNPLQAIQNALFLLKEEKGISAQGQNDLQIVLAESERMTGLVERLRDSYRPAQTEDLQPIHINEIIEDMHALLATHLRKNSIAFEFHPDPGLPAIPAQDGQIRQVALNLLMNAIEEMPDGGKLTVATKYERDTRGIVLSISDSGAGISPAILPFIFDPFVTNKKRGTGIGLTISHDIVVKHRGRISAENNEGAPGATFKVWLPMDAPPGENL